MSLSACSDSMARSTSNLDQNRGQVLPSLVKIIDSYNHLCFASDDSERVWFFASAGHVYRDSGLVLARARLASCGG